MIVTLHLYRSKVFLCFWNHKLLANKNIVIVCKNSVIDFSSASSFVNEGANGIAIGNNPDRIKKSPKIIREPLNRNTRGVGADSTPEQGRYPL